MPQDGPAEGNTPQAHMSITYFGPGIWQFSTETSKLDIEDDISNFSSAETRLKYEAQKARSFGGRAVRDVTEDFATASSQLQPGQLVKDEFFTLFESVGALEVSWWLHVSYKLLLVEQEAGKNKIWWFPFLPKI